MALRLSYLADIRWTPLDSTIQRAIGLEATRSRVGDMGEQGHHGTLRRRRTGLPRTRHRRLPLRLPHPSRNTRAAAEGSTNHGTSSRGSNRNLSPNRNRNPRLNLRPSHLLSLNHRLNLSRNRNQSGRSRRRSLNRSRSPLQNPSNNRKHRLRLNQPRQKRKPRKVLGRRRERRCGEGRRSGRPKRPKPRKRRTPLADCVNCASGRPGSARNGRGKLGNGRSKRSCVKNRRQRKESVSRGKYGRRWRGSCARRPRRRPKNERRVSGRLGNGRPG